MQCVIRPCAFCVNREYWQVQVNFAICCHSRPRNQFFIANIGRQCSCLEVQNAPKTNEQRLFWLSFRQSCWRIHGFTAYSWFTCESCSEFGDDYRSFANAKVANHFDRSRFSYKTCKGKMTALLKSSFFRSLHPVRFIYSMDFRNHFELHKHCLNLDRYIKSVFVDNVQSVLNTFLHFSDEMFASYFQSWNLFLTSEALLIWHNIKTISVTFIHMEPL